MASLISRSLPSPCVHVVVYLFLSVVCFVALRIRANSIKQKELTKSIASPLRSVLPKLPGEKLSTLPYPPDVLPGARDVDTPYGSIRVYEWGPEAGRKVLLVHGISTPCISLATVALKLVDSGCRVMLFDLFGRGFSDTPSAVTQDARLFTTQILLVLASSRLCWTGTNAFSLIGYSLGGGISAAFTAYHPHLVASLVLIAPSGLLREKHIAWQSRVLYQSDGLIPQTLIHSLVRKRLSQGPLVPPKKKDDRHELGTAPNVSTETAVLADMMGASKSPPEPLTADGKVRTASISLDQNSPLFADRPHVAVPAAVQWQLRHHEGFVPAFISSIRHGPILNCHALWARIGSRLSAAKAHPGDADAAALALTPPKVLVVLGRDDQIIIREEIEEDATAALGRENVEFEIVDAAHELPITRARDIVDAVRRFWESGEA